MTEEKYKTYLLTWHVTLLNFKNHMLAIHVTIFLIRAISYSLVVPNKFPNFRIKLGVLLVEKFVHAFTNYADLLIMTCVQVVMGIQTNFFLEIWLMTKKKKKIINKKKQVWTKRRVGKWRLSLIFQKLRKITKQRLGKRFTHHLDFLACFHYRVVRGISQQWLSLLNP